MSGNLLFEFKKIRKVKSGTRVKKVLENKSRIETLVFHDGAVDSYKCYDSCGNYLGLTNDLSAANTACVHGFMLNDPDVPGSDLDLWDLWNNTIWHGNPMLCPETSEQIVGMGNDGNYYLIASRADNGPEVRILSRKQLWDEYGENGYLCFRHLLPGEEPLKLE